MLLLFAVVLLACLPVVAQNATEKGAAPARYLLTSNPVGSVQAGTNKNMPATLFKGRKLGILVTDGIEGSLLASLRAAAAAQGAEVAIVAPSMNGIKTREGERVAADYKINNGPSVLFDAIAILSSPAGTAKLSKELFAKEFVWDAYSHLKFIAFNDAAFPLFQKSGVFVFDEGFKQLKNADDAVDFIDSCASLRFWKRENDLKMSNLSQG